MSSNPFQKSINVDVNAFISGALDTEKINNSDKQSLVDSEIMISIAKLHDNPINARYFYDINRVEELAKMIDRDGQLIPLMITNHPTIKGDYIVIDGGYRLRAMRFLGKIDVRCALVPDVTGFKLYYLSNTINKQRTTQTLLDDAKVWKKLISEKFISSQDELANCLGIGKSQVSKIISLNEIPEDISQLLSSSVIATQINLAYEFALIAKTSSKEELIDLVNHILDNGISLKELISVKKSKEKKNIKNNFLEIKNISFSAENGKKMGFMKVENKKIALNFTALSDQKANELSEKINALVRDYL